MESSCPKNLSSILLSTVFNIAFLPFFIRFAVPFFIKLLLVAFFKTWLIVSEILSMIPPFLIAVCTWDNVSNFPVTNPIVLFPRSTAELIAVFIPSFSPTS